MRRRIPSLLLIVAGMLLLMPFLPNTPQVFAQQPTGSVPTVTGTPSGPYVQVYQDIPVIKVYSGPSSLGEYPAIGILLANETAPALARARGKQEWIQIIYDGVPGSVGWIFGPYVRLFPGDNGQDLTLIDAPSTPTPVSTPTIDPTLVAAFIGQQTPTRLPTFTPPPPLDLPQFTDTSSNTARAGIPTGLLILSLALFGFFGVVISYLRGR